MHHSRYKIIKTGKLIEAYIAEKPFQNTHLPENFERHADIEPKNIPREYFENPEHPDRSDEYRARNAFRARNAIRRLCQTNFTKRAKFITLTFRDTNDFNIKDPRETIKLLQNFIRKLQYKYGDIKYIVVTEFQTENCRDAVHYHMICNLPYFHHTSLEALWGHGFIRINAVEKSRKVGFYMGKYLTKDLYTKYNFRFRKFITSKNLDKPTVIYGLKAYQLLERLEGSDRIQYCFSNSYPSRYNGLINYIEYDFYQDTEGGEDNERNHQGYT